MLVDDFGDGFVFVALAVDHVAPVAPDRADIQQDWLVFGFCTREGGFTPFMPVDGLVRSRTQVRAGGIFQTILRLVRQWKPFRWRGDGQTLECLRYLLHDVAGAGVARIERFAAGETFVLAVVETNAILA